MTFPIKAEVVDCRMMTTVVTETGDILELSAGLPKGTVISIHCLGINDHGEVTGYAGYDVISRAPRVSTPLTSAEQADLACMASEVFV